ncbi:MAG: hypothetical protein NC033_02405 [Clostridiales bacterium]|nr:hypothetical protein [Clostridiales bacterium]
MKDNQLRNEPVTADTAEAERENAAAELGKFKDVKALMDAYQALEAEFTRRSQRLKELEAKKDTEAPAKISAENAEVPSQEGEKESGAGVSLSSLGDEVKNAVIEEYLNGVFSKRGVPFVTGGGAVATQRRTPSTLKEAGALAGKLFSDKEEN